MYRDDLEALAARRSALATEVDHATRERDAAADALNHARTRAKLPVLDDIRVASPCKVPWDRMAGDDRVRFCGSCNQQVFNLSSMTRDEAEELLLAQAHLCVRYFRRADGTILLADCAVGARRRRDRRMVAAGLAAVLGTGALAHEVEQWANTPPRYENHVQEPVGAIADDTYVPPPPGDWEQGGDPNW